MENRDTGNVSPEFLFWEQKDQLLLLWLQSIIFSEVLPRLIVNSKYS